VRHAGAVEPTLRDVSLQIAPGEVVGLLGESGAGKTTLALALLRLLPAGSHAEGSIRWRGRELLGLPEREMNTLRGAEIAHVFQEPALALNPVRRAGRQVAEVLRAHRTMGRRDLRSETARRLEEVGLKEARFLEAYPHELSGGQRQRVAVAQALAGGPSLLVADEPTSALDPILQAEVLGLLADRARDRGLALLFITHQPALLSGWADRTLRLAAGRIEEPVPAAFVS